jgi:hypothetical protein
MPVTVDELNQATAPCFKVILEKEGIDGPFLARQLKRELKSKETKIISIDGCFKTLEEIIVTTAAQELDEKTLKKIKKLANSSGIRILGASKDKTLVAIDMVNWGTQQSARMDAHKLRGDYAVVTKKVQFDEVMINAILSGLPAGIGEAVRAELVKAISNKRD